MALLGSLAVAVVGEVGKLKTAFKEVKTESKSLGREVEKSGIGLKQIAKYGMMAGTAIVGALTTMTVSVAKSAEKIDLLAKQTGISREALQGLAYAAQQEGTSIEVLGVGLARLSRNMYDASRGTGESKDAFKSLGITVKDSNGKLRDSSDVLIDLANKMQNMTSETEMQALAMQVLGRGAQDLVPFLRMGGDEIQRLIQEARDLGYVLDEESIIAMEAFGDEMEAMKTGFAGIGRRIAADVVPYINSFIKGVTSVLKWLHQLPEPIRKTITVGTLLAGVFALIGGGLMSLVIKINAAKLAMSSLGMSFGPFLIGGAILAGVGLLITHMARLKEEARLASLEIAKTFSLEDLQAEKKRIEDEIKRIEGLIEKNKNQKAPYDTLDSPYVMSPSGDFGFGSVMLRDSLKDTVIPTKPLEKYNDELDGLKTRLAEVTDRIKELNKESTTTFEDKFVLSDYLKEIEKGLSDIDKIAQAFGDTSDVAKDKTSLLHSAIEKLIDEGFDPSRVKVFDKSIIDLYNDFRLSTIEMNETLSETNAAWVRYSEAREKAEEAARQERLEEEKRIEQAEKEITVYDFVERKLIEQSELREKLAQQQKDATDLVAEAQAKLVEMTGLAVPEWEAFAQRLEEAAAGYGVLPETAEQLQNLAEQIREVGRASEEVEPTTFVEAWHAGLSDVDNDAKTYLEHIRDIAATTAEAMANSFSDLFYDSVHGEFKSLLDYALAVFDSISRAWSNMMGEMAAKALTNWLFPGIGAGGFTGGGGSYTAMANGGAVFAGSAYMVGERGPEAFIPRQNGTIVPNHALGTAVEVNVINQTGQPVSARQGEVKFDGQRYVVNVLLDAVSRNVGGIRDALKGGK